MTRPLFVLCAVSSAAFAQSGASVCGQILLGSEKAGCLAVVAGHTVQPGAAAVCAGLLMGTDKTACLQASLDKTYGPDELAACKSILMGRDRVACMASAGIGLRRRREAVEDEPRRRVRDDDDDDRPRRRRRDEDDDRPSRRRSRDDDDDQPRGRPSRSDDDAQRILRLTNHHGASVVRFYWGRPGDRRYREVRLPYVVGANTFQDVSVPDGTIGACVETADGFFLFWERVRADQNLVIDSHERNWARGACN
jgi:hypothetical protein